MLRMESNRTINEEGRHIEKQGNKKSREEALKECSIAVFGIPLVAGDRLLKLKNYLAKLFSKPSAEFFDVYPLDEEGKTKGYCFIKYDSKETAKVAVLLLDNHRFDSNHTFSALPMAAFDKIEKPSETFVPPQLFPLVDVGDLWSWMQKPNCFDQFAVRFGSSFGKDDCNTNLCVYWNGHDFKEPSLESEIQTEYKNGVFKWSPEGSYLANVEQNSVDLYGGPDFKKAKSFEHKQVDFIEFSPKESFLVSYSSKSRCSDDGRLKIFNVCTGELEKCFSWPSGQSLSLDVRGPNGWPFIKWSSDESYFAFSRANLNSLAVFRSDTFSLCNLREIEMPGLVSFNWNPAKPLLAYYCEQVESSNVPAEVGIMEIPSREKLRSQRILLSVSAANLFWKKSGDYLAAFTKRYNHAKKIKNKDTKEVDEIRHRNITYNLDIFDCSGSDVSVITMQLPGSFCDFAWEPKGNKFCVLVGSENKMAPMVYQVEREKPTPVLISKISSGSLHSILWAPQGGWLAAYGYSSILFIDASGSEAIASRAVEHENMNKAYWDPTGRYFVTCVTGMETESGVYRVHNFQGRLLYRKNGDMSLLSFKWRPRPPSVLTEQKTREIRKNLKQLSLKFEEDDRQEQMAVFNKQNSHHREAMAVFTAIREHNRMLYDKEHHERLKLRNKIESDETTEEDLVDEIITVPLVTEEMKIAEQATE